MSIDQTITELRKRNGWSQEDLAYKLDVSRQSVSKWESGQSVPEPEKIVKLSELFDVPTDYILKGAGGSPAYEGQHQTEVAGVGECIGVAARNLSSVEANDAIDTHKKSAKGLAAGIGICILSPACLIIMAGYVEYMKTSEKLILIGVAVLLGLVALAVGIIISNGLKLSKYGFIEDENIILERKTEDDIRKKYEAYSPTFVRGIIVGVVLCIMGVIPLIIALIVTENPLTICIMVALLFAFAAVAVYIFVRVCVVKGVYQKLLQEGEYTLQGKKHNKNIDAFSAAYWCIITAAYLAINFIWGQWGKSWIIWLPAAGVFVAVKGIMAAKVGSKNK